jgi:pSer/pThr/pTyr-binding forkhead associated (FHA) protein
VTSKKTTILERDSPRIEPLVPPQPVEMIDLGVIRPWRLALLIIPDKVELILNLTGEVTLGRADPRNAIQPDIDLRPFRAEELGVSRQHLFLRLEGDSVAVIDNNSSNGTRLNGARLEAGRSYALQHGDHLAIGALDVQVQLLSNPLD